MGYIGRDNSLSTFTKQSITADGGTSFTLNQGVGDSSSILVSIGGIVQQPDVAYSASGTALVFTSAPTNAYPIWVVYLGKELTVSSETGCDEVDTQAGVGNGSATPITLDNSVSSVNDIIVTLNGIAQKPSTDYTVSGTTLTFTTAPSAAMNILVYYLSLSGAANTPANGSVSTASQFVSSGTWPAWNGTNLINAGGDATQADIDGLIASLATLSFLQNIDHSTALLNMVNGWSDTFITSPSVDDEGRNIPLTMFDGTNDVIRTGSDLTGMADGLQGTFSCWIDFTGGDGVLQQFITNEGGYVQIEKATTNKFHIMISRIGGGGTKVWDALSSTTYTAPTGKLHFMSSWNGTTGTMYVNGVDVLGTNSKNTGTNADYTRSNWSVGADCNGAFDLSGSIGQVYFDDSYIDLTVAANRKKFYNSGAVDFGANGSTPTGSQPLIYLNNPHGTFQTNLGTGGNYAVTGSLVDGGYANDKIYSSDSFTNPYELIQGFGKENISGTNGFTVGDHKKAGQCITLPACSISKIGFWVRRVGNIQGHVTAEIHGVTGTPGSSATSNGIILAQSKALESASESTSMHLMLFDFPSSYVHSGGNLWIGINAFNMSGGGSTYLHMMQNNANGDTDGNAAKQASNLAWTGYASNDILYYVYGTENLDLKTKGTDALTTVASPASAPTKGHIEALVDDRIINGLIKDSSSSPHTITPFGDAAISTTQKKIGTHSIKFDGNNDELQIPHTNELAAPSTDFTMEFWFNPTTRHQAGLMSVGNTTTNGQLSWCFLMLSTGYISFYTHLGAYVAVPSPADSITAGAWNHVAAVRSGNIYTCYMNGIGGTPVTNASAFSNYNTPLRIGNESNGIEDYNGYIDEVRISNTARYTANFTPSTTAFTSDANTKLLIHGDEEVTYPTLNTHVVGEMSRDGGSTWSPATLARSSTGIDGATAEIFSGDVDFTGDPSGTNVVGRIRTANKHKVIVDGISVNWS